MALLNSIPPTWVLIVCSLGLLVVFFFLPTDLLAALNRKILHTEHAQTLTAIAAAIGFVVVLATAFQIMTDLDDRVEERQHRKAEAVAQSWSRLVAPIPGSTGKAGALMHLISAGEPLHGLDISCQAVGKWEPRSNRCTSAPIYDGLEIDGNVSGDPVGRMKFFSGINISWTGFVRSKIVATHFQNVNLSHSKYSESVGIDSVFQGDLTNAEIIDSNIVGSVFAGKLEGLTFRNVVVSNAAFSAPEKAFGDHTSYVIAWADAPPRLVEETQFRSIRREQVTKLDTSVLRPVPLVVLERIKLCRPPQKGGRDIPLIDRDIPRWGCSEISPREAITVYPDVYKGY